MVHRNKQTTATKDANLLLDAYCVKCKHNGKLNDACKVETANHRMQLRGLCEKCGGKVCRFLKMFS